MSTGLATGLPWRLPPPRLQWTVLAALDDCCSPVDRDDGEIEFVIDSIQRRESRAQHEFLIPGGLVCIERPVRDSDQRDRVRKSAEQSVEIRVVRPCFSSMDSLGHTRSAQALLARRMWPGNCTQDRPPNQAGCGRPSPVLVNRRGSPWLAEADLVRNQDRLFQLVPDNPFSDKQLVKLLLVRPRAPGGVQSTPFRTFRSRPVSSRHCAKSLEIVRFSNRSPSTAIHRDDNTP